MSDFTPLASLCEFIVDCEHKTAPLAPVGYPSIRTPNVGKGRLILEGVNRVSEETYSLWTKRAVPQEQDLIIAREAPVGNVAIIPKGLDVCLGQRTVLVRPDPRKVVPAYLCYFLLGDYAQARFRATSSGATVAHLNMKDIRSLPVPRLPSLETQRRIASILGAYDDLIEVNRRRVAVLEEMARGLFEEWFVRFRFPGHESVATVDTPEGPLPNGWAFDLLGNVAEINAASIRPATAPAEIGYIDIASVSPGQIDGVTKMPFVDAPGRARRRVKDGSILWSNVRPNRRSYALVLDPTPDIIASTGFAVLDARETTFTYLYHWVTTDNFVGYLVGNATGAAYPAVTASTFERASILMPSSDVVEQYTQVAEPMMRQANNLRQAGTVLAASRDLLLPRLISGQLSVEGAERELEAAA